MSNPWRLSWRNDPVGRGYQDGLESPHDLSMGMTWPDPEGRLSRDG